MQRQRENISKERAVRAFMYRELRKTWNVLSEGCRERVSAIKVAKLLGEEQARAEAAELRAPNRPAATEARSSRR